MKNKPYKFVLLPIKVPEGNYCWDGHVVCEYFDNEGGHPHCLLNLEDFKYSYDKEGKVPKPKKCLLCINAMKGDINEI